MAKRKPLLFDGKQLTRDLQESAGKGVDAFFPSSSIPTPSKKTQGKNERRGSPRSKSSPTRRAKRKSRKKKESRKSLQASQIESKQSSNIAILQLDEADIEHLREAAYKAQTYRFSHREMEWVKDTAYTLSKEMRRGKVAQVDILRVAIKLFENALSIDKKKVMGIIKRIK